MPMKISVKVWQDSPSWLLHIDCLGETSICAVEVALLLTWWQDSRVSSTRSPQRGAAVANTRLAGGFPQNIHSAVDIFLRGRGAKGNAQASSRLLFFQAHREQYMGWFK